MPILVEDRLWGALGILTDGHRLPPETEDRLQKFTELVAAALANSHARAEVRQLADEQTALRRVAELVARGVPPHEVFAAVAVEAGAPGERPGDDAHPLRERARARRDGQQRGPGRRRRAHRDPREHLADRVRSSARTTRVDDYAGELDLALARKYGLVATVAAPISVEGRVWGMLTATSAEGPLEPGTEHRLSQFADLVGAAIANAENRANLTASRARVVATADETRGRIQRDLHDGAQQRLVQTYITLQQAREAIARGDSPAELVEEAVHHAERANQDLRDLVRGIMPASLTRGGLGSALETLLDDVPLPVDLELDVPRLHPSTETTAYFIVAEALTNVVKHARATRAQVRVALRDDRLILEVGDDGVGGADPSLGTGLTGLSDRVAVGEGTIAIESRPGEGTILRAQLPVPATSRGK